MMTSDRKKHDAIVAEAASWVAQIDSQSMSKADRAALREWAARSPRHMEELRRLGEMWCDLDDFLLAGEAKEAVPSSLTGVLVAGFRTRPGFAYAMAAVFVLAISIPIAWTWTGKKPTEPLFLAYQTLPGETQKVTLDDGSILHINTNSSLQYSSSESRREVQLYRGEVLVEVAKDPQRPFSVRAGQVTTTALGTVFSVRMRSNETVVMVTHGSVQFEPSDRIKAEEALLEAGDVASVEFSGAAPRAEIVSVEPELLSQKLAWKDGLLIFDGDPLTEVIDEVTRYTDTSVVISDPSLREIPIGGVFRIGEVSPFIGALESSFGIEAEYVDPNTVYLRRIE